MTDQLEPSYSKLGIIYVSCADDASIACYQLDYTQQTIKPFALVPTGNNVMPLAVHPDNHYLYASIRSEPYHIECFQIDKTTGKLIKQADSLLPASMAYITTDKKGLYLLSASYNNSLVTINTIDQQGIVSDEAHIEPTGLYAHSIIVHPNNKFVYAASLGGDRIHQYYLDNEAGLLKPMEQSYTATLSGSGARHMVIENTGNHLYILTEMHASILCYQIHPITGSLSLIDINEDFPATHYALVKSKLRELVTEEEATNHIWAADIKITANGKFLYITERTSSTLSMYQRNQQTGKLTYIETILIEKQPRSIAIDPTDQYLVTTGQQDTQIGLYLICQATGKLTPIAQATTGKNANWVEIITL